MLPAGETLPEGWRPRGLEGRVLAANGLVQGPWRGPHDRSAHAGRARRGRCAASAGNHAQAVTLAAVSASRADLFMPVAAPLAKVAAVRGYGGVVHLVEGCYEEAARRPPGSPSETASARPRPRRPRGRRRRGHRPIGDCSPGARHAAGRRAARWWRLRRGDRDRGHVAPPGRRWSASRPTPARRISRRSPRTGQLGHARLARSATASPSSNPAS